MAAAVSATAQGDALTLQFLEWVAAAPRTRDDTVAVWQTFCPRHAIFEDALGDGLVAYGEQPGGTLVVTPLGRDLLDQSERRRR